MSAPNVKQQVDQMCDETALLLFGVRYAQLDPVKRDAVIGEIVLGLDPRIVDLVDAIEE
jgi:hypothetical protein